MEYVVTPKMITHLGAKNCVTGLCHLIRTHPDSAAFGINILVDCGKAYCHDPTAL